MTVARWAMLVYGLAMIGMGLDGYLRAGSPMSLYGGGGLGAVVLIALWMSMSMKTPRWGYILGVLMAVAALGRFLPSYLKARDPYPALVIVVLSAALVVVLIGGHFAAQHTKSGA
jgi:uncharacterized membrane protein (UPF0136 family)